MSKRTFIGAGLCALALGMTLSMSVQGEELEPQTRAAKAGTKASAPDFGRLAVPERFQGTVRERIPAGSYLYLHIQPDDSVNLRWVVTLWRDLAVGARVQVTNFGERTSFASARTGRTFERLGFAYVAEAPPPDAPVRASAVAPAHDPELDPLRATPARVGVLRPR